MGHWTSYGAGAVLSKRDPFVVFSVTIAIATFVVRVTIALLESGSDFENKFNSSLWIL